MRGSRSAAGRAHSLGPKPGRRLTKVWQVDATTNAIIELGEQLAGLGVERVTVESTSDYVRAWFYLLEAAGLGVQLVNAHQVKNVPGRPKTDRLDAVWLAKLTERGMLRPSFVPPPRSASCATTPGCGST
jgi:transposase